jgi:hypothetical protein
LGELFVDEENGDRKKVLIIVGVIIGILVILGLIIFVGSLNYFGVINTEELVLFGLRQLNMLNSLV